MLEKTCAYIVSETKGSGEFLYEACDRLGVGHSRTYVSARAAERQVATSPVCFFLFPASENSEFICHRLREIRTSKEPNICFASAMLLTPDAQTNRITSGVSLGFDEILAPPCSPDLLKARFKRQLSKGFEYFSTETYFGPDRRRGSPARNQSCTNKNRDQTFHFRRYNIRRNIVNGIEVLTDEKFRVRNGVKKLLPA